MSAGAADKAINYWLDRLKLARWKNSKTDELSKGMQQKIQFIATVMHDPDLLILDELFSGIDPVNAELMKEVVLDLKAAGRTIIFSTHMMEQAETCDDLCQSTVRVSLEGVCVNEKGIRGSSSRFARKVDGRERSGVDLRREAYVTVVVLLAEGTTRSSG